MRPFTYCVPTDIRFGQGTVSCLGEALGKYGRKVLLVYGGGSIKKTGLYDKVMEQLKGYEVTELPGIEPNPKIGSVREGARICKEKGIEVVLAVGGGSTVDASKAIAGGACYDGDPWDLVLDSSKVKAALPIADMLTMSATGSEMNPGGVISNPETREKLEVNNPHLYPSLSILDPTILYTVPPKQTAAGTADIISHVCEQYFQPYDGAYIMDRLCEGVLQTAFKYGPAALKKPDDYEARSNLMWAATIGLNDLLSRGKGGEWSVHPIEHVLSAYYDITHGVGLAILTPSWMRHVLSEKTEARFAMYAKNVFGIDTGDTRKDAEAGIDRTEEFFVSMGLPKTLREVGIGPEKFEEMAKEAVRTSRISWDAYVHLNPEDVLEIFRMCE